ncbi:MAG: hypothetical protein IT422_15510 [Pirellulaceae bacterium]|nr:hypothetical protein [Pirellulaceae bacterium]
MLRLIKSKGYDEPEMYCLADKVEGKYRQPYREEKEPDGQSAVNTIRVIIEGKPQAIGEYLPRLKAVIAPPADRVYYYVPKETRKEAHALARRLGSSANTASVD